MRTKFLATLLVASTLLVGCSSGEKSSTPSSTTVSESKVSSVSSEAPKEASSQSKPKTQVYGVGETVEVDGLKITVNSSQDTDDADQYNTAANLDEGNTYNILDITIENDSDEEVTISSALNFEVKDGDGRKASYVLAIRGNGQLDGSILPGDKMTGELVTQAPRDGELNLYFKSSAFNGSTVKIKVR